MNFLQQLACKALYSMPAFLIPDKTYLKLLWKIRMGGSLDLSNPVTFNEKLQWIKLYDRNPLYSQLVDKGTVKEWVAERIGSRFVIPTYAIWDNIEEIDWDSLPNKFVIKCTHDSGSVVICRDKHSFDTQEAAKRLSRGLKSSTYKKLREWPYKNVKPRIIAEQLLVDKQSGDLPDYKFYCFDGEMKLLGIYTNRNQPNNIRATFFDRNFNQLDFEWAYPKSDKSISKPDRFDEMLKIAETLSQGIPEIRVDLYLCNGRIYFGEMTFFDGSGLAHFNKPEYDMLLGSWLHLPEKRND